MPDVLMTRAGLLVGTDILDAGDALTAWCGLGVSRRWGMSPFAGHATDPVWAAVNVHHLWDLVTALRLRTDKNRLGRYRELLRAKVTPAVR